MELESNLKYVSLNRMMKACRFLHILSTGCIAPWSTILAVTLRLRLCLRRGYTCAYIFAYACARRLY